MIVIFNGPPGSGKDEAASWFCDHGFRHLSFKHELYKETVKIFNVEYDWFMDGYNNRDIKENREPKLNDMSRREAMIHTSECYIKPKFGADYFGAQVASQIEPNYDYAISDGGFVEELRPLIARVGLDQIRLVQLTREGCSYSTDSRRYFRGVLVGEYGVGGRTDIDDQYVLEESFDIDTYRLHNNGSIHGFHSMLNELINVI